MADVVNIEDFMTRTWTEEMEHTFKNMPEGEKHFHLCVLYLLNTYPSYIKFVTDNFNVTYDISEANKKINLKISEIPTFRTSEVLCHAPPEAAKSGIFSRIWRKITRRN